jgi:hypothetical protein
MRLSRVHMGRLSVILLSAGGANTVGWHNVADRFAFETMDRRYWHARSERPCNIARRVDAAPPGSGNPPEIPLNEHPLRRETSLAVQRVERSKRWAVLSDSRACWHDPIGHMIRREWIL